MVRPIDTTPTISAPNSVPRMEPRPPNSEMPPITAAVMACRLWSVTAQDGEIEPLRPIEDPGGKSGNQTGQRIGAEKDAISPDAGELGGFWIVADGVEMPAPVPYD